MPYEEDIVRHIFSPKTVEKAKQQFIDNVPIVNADSEQNSFRLFITDGHHINLEHPILTELEESSEEIDLAGIGVETLKKTMLYFKPVAIYTSDNKVVILKEFESAYYSLRQQNLIESKLVVQKLSVLENAVIASFSVEMYRYAMLKKDVRGIRLNGLNLDMLLTWDKDPQIWLDDKYNVNHAIGIYFPDGSSTINPMRQTKQLFDQFHEMQLLTIFKKIFREEFLYKSMLTLVK